MVYIVRLEVELIDKTEGNALSDYVITNSGFAMIQYLIQLTQKFMNTRKNIPLKKVTNSCIWLMEMILINSAILLLLFNSLIVNILWEYKQLIIFIVNVQLIKVMKVKSKVQSLFFIVKRIQ